MFLCGFTRIEKHHSNRSVTEVDNLTGEYVVADVVDVIDRNTIKFTNADTSKLNKETLNYISIDSNKEYTVWFLAIDTPEWTKERQK